RRAGAGAPPRRACRTRDLLDTQGCEDCQNQPAQTVTVVDPRHPLYGQTFRVAVQHRSPRAPRSFEVHHRDGIILRIAASATDYAYQPPASPRTTITCMAIRQLLGLLADWRPPCASRPDPSGGDSPNESDETSAKPSSSSGRRASEPSSELIRPAHPTRGAVIYIRQSSPQQVISHQESLRLQYDLRRRAVACGWPESAIDVIDTDLGQTARTTQGRAGFAELVSRVTLGEVGIIFSYDVTRLARNCTDWYQLLDLCGFRDCLVGDQA